MTADRQAKLSVRGTFGEMWRVYRSHWRFLVPAAMVVLLPQAVADGVLEDFHVEHLKSFADFATLGAALLTVAVNLMGQAVYAGLTAAAVVDWRAGQPLPQLSALVRSLPIARLIALDVVVTIGAAVGLVLLVVPGLIFLTYVAASAPVMKLEHLGVWDSIKRSVELVKGRARQVFVIVGGIVFLTEAAVQAIAVPFHGAGLLAGVNLIGEGIFQPFEGLVVAVVAIHLLELHGQAPAPEAMAEALVAEHD
jgi:hypothetical protein